MQQEAHSLTEDGDQTVMPWKVRRAWWWVVVVMFTPALILIYGRSANFFPSKQYWSDVHALSIVSSAIVFVALLFGYLFLLRNDGKLRPTDKRWKWIPLGAALMALWPGVVFQYAAMNDGVPAIASLFTGTPAVMTFSAGDNIPWRPDGCVGRPTVYIKHPTTGPTYICPLSRKIWRQARRSGKIEFTGWKSYFGFRYDSYRLIND